ncbi:MAG TPA: flagellar biosynthesis protein FlhA [Leptospiraceae bacterium]|nr:flagellar biosynthesis protein FlhA [Spirochaetaceae bacterium]HBS05858.1 flagellar biosynthesis protein FlhA [Leptospiraceae bacterium]|tara:strand:- start:15105 stop:17246 length:2142 start_codon:yes stop_codon:yes gene_type:complete
MKELLEQITKHFKSTETVLGLGVVFILVLIIVPLPGVLLDVLIAVSLLSAILILMTSLGTNSPAEFTAFPTLLLITTIYRLAVNISTTRMILTEGDQADSALVSAFGSFVVGGGNSMGSYVVGIIIFLILTLVQIIVITKGATRVSEVAARFALDSLPGKQLAIDSDQQAGYIDEREARRRRNLLQTEMNFYGAMDGASKFVQGDVRLGLVITAINIIGGLILGVTIQGESFTNALEIYTRFTIGDGLVSQIPALLISAATGIIVSRSTSEDSLPHDLKTQLLSNTGILYVTGGFLILAGFLPGFPLIAMASLGGGLIYLGYQMDKSKQKKVEEEARQEQEKSDERKPESYLEHLRTEPLEVEIGYSLIPLVDPKQGGTLLDQISRLRRRFAMESGLIVPPVRIRDNMNLEAGEYNIKLQGSSIAGSTLESEKLMAIDTGRTTGTLEGLASFQEPTYGLKAYWIDPTQKSEAEGMGFDVVDPSTVIATHLSSVIQQNSQEIMGRQEIKSIIDSVREDNPVVVDELMGKDGMTLGQVQTVLKNLLKEGVSIRNMTKILETVSDHLDRGQPRDPYLITESVRQALKRQVVGDLIGGEKKLRVITLDPGLDRRLREGIHRDPELGFVMSLKPDVQVALRDALEEEVKKSQDAGRNAVFLTSSAVRAGIFYILERLFPIRNFAVLAHEEIPSDIDVEAVSQLSLRSRAEEEMAGAQA